MAPYREVVFRLAAAAAALAAVIHVLGLTLPVLYSHGGSAWATWQREDQFRWIDLAAIVAIPLALALLIADRASRRRRL